MRLLLDTHAFLWWRGDDARLGAAEREAIRDGQNDVFLSAVTIWEIAIKHRKGRLAGVEEYLARYSELHARWGFSTVVIEPADAVAAGILALPHDDPFDRMLIVQGKRLGARIVTCDDAIRRHVPGCIW